MPSVTHPAPSFIAKGTASPLETSLLDRVNVPTDLRRITDADLATLADEVRAEVISVLSETGGHLGSSLGVVELTVAIHAVFNTTVDKLNWDVGHQFYPHKSLKERRVQMRSLRQGVACPAFPSGRSPPMTRLVPPTVPPAFPPHLVLPSAVTWAYRPVMQLW